MADIIHLTDQTFADTLNGDRPVLLLITTGEGLRGDFKTAFDTAAKTPANVVFARLDPSANPAAARQFEAGNKPMLIAWYCGEEIARRPRPWGSDLPLALELLTQTVRERPAAIPPAYKEMSAVNNDMSVNGDETAIEEVVPSMRVILTKPVAVTDGTFENDVLAASLDMPVLIDFWAAWCGPCRMVAPILDKLAGEFAGQIKIAKVDVDANPQLSQAFRVQSIPNLMIIKERTMIFNQPGALPEAALRDLIQQAIAVQIPPQQQEER